MQAGEKKFKYEKSKTCQSEVIRQRLRIGDMGHTDYVLVADDIVAVEEK